VVRSLYANGGSRVRQCAQTLLMMVALASTSCDISERTRLDETRAAAAMQTILASAYQPVSLSAGAFHSLAMTEDGTTWAWGGNGDGNVGTEGARIQTTPVPVAVWSEVSQVSAGQGHSLALTRNGEVLAWGRGQFGQVGDGVTQFTSAPVRVNGLPRRARSVTAGWNRSFAVLEDGTLWAWGEHSYMALGAPIVHSGLPFQVNLPGPVRSVADGQSFTLALLENGDVWAWGFDNHGQLGLESTTYESAIVPQPARIPSLSGVVKIAAGLDHSLAVMSDGTVRSWGANNAGQLGDGMTDPQRVPHPVPGLNDARDVAASTLWSLALVGDGTLRAWGRNTSGQLGDATRSYHLTPVVVGNVSNITVISAGVSHGLAFDSECHVIWAWGDNDAGQLGDGRRHQNLPPDYSPRAVAVALGNGVQNPIWPLGGWGSSRCRLLHVMKAGVGAGTVNSSTGGISCGSPCLEAYERISGSAHVVLSAVPDSGSTFDGWSGACRAAGGNRDAPIVIGGSTSCTALFRSQIE